MDDRRCKACQKPLSQREKESKSAFEKRLTCDAVCSSYLPSEVRPFKSLYTQKFITPAAYIAETMVSRIARKEQAGRDLPGNFHSVDKWERFFKVQLRHAASLLKLYSYEALIKALRTYKGKTVYSLGAKFLDPLIKDEQEKINRVEEKKKEAVADTPAVIPEIVEPRPNFVQETAFSKLKGL